MKKKIAVLLLGLLAPLAAIIGIQLTMAPSASAYCIENIAFERCYSVVGVDDTGSYDVFFEVKCGNQTASPFWLHEPNPYVYSSDGRFDQWVDPSLRAQYSPCSDYQHNGVTGIRMDPAQNPYGRVMCKSPAGIWPGFSFVQVSHDDGSWRYFPSANNSWHRLECKTVAK